MTALLLLLNGPARWGWDFSRSPVGRSRRDKQKRCRFPYTALRYDTKPITTTLSRKHKTAIMRKGVAKCYCVGGSVSCIGAWEVAASHVLPLFISMALFYSITEQIARSFETVRKGPFFVVQRVAVCDDGSQVARHGWSLGAVSRLGVRRGQRLVPLHGISPLWVR